MDDRRTHPPVEFPAHAERRDRWLAAFDETLAGLAAERPLGEILGEILRLAARGLEAPHGFLQVHRADDQRSVEWAGLGAWAGAPPAELAMEVERSGALIRLMAPPPLGAALAVPIRTRAHPVGALGLAFDRESESQFAAEASELLVRFAQVAAVAYENDRLVSTERAAREEEEALRAATQALSASLRLQDVLEVILTELQNVVPHDSASVQELQGDRMVIVGGRGIDLDHFLGFGFSAFGSGGPNSDVLRRKGPVIVADILGGHPYADFPDPEHALSGVRSFLGVPMLFGNVCTGMLTLDKREIGYYTERHAEAATAFAAQAAIALENARLYESSQAELAERRRAEDELREANRSLELRIAEIEALEGRLREQAVRDTLTGLYNRRYFSETLQRELARCRREGRPLSLALIDLDHFKEVNDAYGHEAGDRVLALFGRFLLDRTRTSDIACRYGGEEFVVLLPGAAGLDASTRADGWRAALQRLRVPHEGRALALTISIGVAEVPAHASSADELIRIADVALYQAKREGRNRVVLAR